MPHDDSQLTAKIAAGEKFGPDDALSAAYRGEVMRLMAVFVDSELAGAAGFVTIINQAPGLDERIGMARLVSEKFAHGRDVLAVMEAFGANPSLYVRSHSWAARLDRSIDLGARRIGGDKRLNVFHYPVEGWTDALMLILTMGAATAIQMAELTDCSYAPLAAIMDPIVGRESEHAQFAEDRLSTLLAENGRAAAQASADYWLPRVAATFGRMESDRVDVLRAYGLRRRSNAELLGTWRDAIKNKLDKLGLTHPS